MLPVVDVVLVAEDDTSSNIEPNWLVAVDDEDDDDIGRVLEEVGAAGVEVDAVSGINRVEPAVGLVVPRLGVELTSTQLTT